MPRGPLRPRRVAQTAVVLLAWAAAWALGVTACVIETEGAAPPKTLLRDTLRARVPAPPALSASAAPVLVLPAPPQAVPEAFRACQSNADCVATLPHGCCQNGRHEALNKGLVDAYRSSFACPTEHPTCPTDLVLDARVAVCDSHLCKLVDAPVSSVAPSPSVSPGSPSVPPESKPGNAGAH